MFTKFLIIIVMIAILYSLGSGLFYLIKDKGKSKRTIRALTWRIGLSIGLFILLFIAFALGLITPHGVYV
jgi:succinate dehydrogenase hydrophobic anchor subunit